MKKDTKDDFISYVLYSHKIYAHKPDVSDFDLIVKAMVERVSELEYYIAMLEDAHSSIETVGKELQFCIEYVKEESAKRSPEKDGEEVSPN